MVRSPTKSAKTPLRGATPDKNQKLLTNLIKAQQKDGKKTSPKSQKNAIPQIADEFLS